MKPCLLRPQGRSDWRGEVRYYRREAGAKVAANLVAALRRAMKELTRQPGIGSPLLGQELGIQGMRAWRVAGFPLSLWYFEREEHIDVVRLVGHRQDALEIEVERT